MQWPGGGKSVTEQTDHFVPESLAGKIGKWVTLRSRASTWRRRRRAGNQGSRSR
jgi:hypothetical protein